MIVRVTLQHLAKNFAHARRVFDHILVVEFAKRVVVLDELIAKQLTWRLPFEKTRQPKLYARVCEIGGQVFFRGRSELSPHGIALLGRIVASVFRLAALCELL